MRPVRANSTPIVDPKDTTVIEVPDSSQYVKFSINGEEVGHSYVDLGLESGIMWATYNIGAIEPTEYGDYYAWGETQTKKVYDWSTYKWSNDDTDTSLTKYCNLPYYGEVDNKLYLEASDDVTTVKLGSDWRMPTSEEFDELIENCQSIWCLHIGVFGRKFIGKNGNMIFLPASGFISGDESYFKQESAYYFSSSLQDFDFAYILNFNNRGIEKNISSLVSGYTICGVRKD